MREVKSDEERRAREECIAVHTYLHSLHIYIYIHTHMRVCIPGWDAENENTHEATHWNSPYVVYST